MNPITHEKLDILIAAAQVSDFGYGEWAYRKWVELNEQFWNGQLEPGGIFWGLTPHGSSLGFYEPWRNAITLHTSLVKPKGDAWGQAVLLGEKFAEDVLLHEMIHQSIHQLTDYRGKESHNCAPWCKEVNRLIPMLGLETDLKAEVVKLRRVKNSDGKGSTVTRKEKPGVLPRRMLARFPHSLRQKGYYEQGTEQLQEQVAA